MCTRAAGCRRCSPRRSAGTSTTPRSWPTSRTTRRNRALVQRQGAAAHIPRRHWLTVDRFTYETATDTLLCPRGQRSAHRYREDGHRTLYTFTPAQCRGCPDAGLGPAQNKGRVRVAIADHHLARLRGRPSSMPTIEYERKRIERKFGQAKVHHGLARARYRGLATMLVQGLLAFFVLNAKRMARLVAIRALAARYDLIERPAASPHHPSHQTHPSDRPSYRS